VEEALAYLPTLALFGFVLVASALMRHEMLILACIPPVFIAMIVGFVMAIYAGDTFGWLPTGGMQARMVVGPAAEITGSADRDLPGVVGSAGSGPGCVRLSRSFLIGAAPLHRLVHKSHTERSNYHSREHVPGRGGRAAAGYRSLAAGRVFQIAKVGS
jgi:hypothetical protein